MHRAPSLPTGHPQQPQAARGFDNLAAFADRWASEPTWEARDEGWTLEGWMVLGCLGMGVGGGLMMVVDDG